MRKIWLYALCLCSLAINCSSADSDNGSSSGAGLSQMNKPTEVAAKKAGSSADELRAQFEQITRIAQGHVGVAATLLETGESVAINGQEHFPMQSVYKLPIGMAVLHRIDDGKLKLEQRVRVERSDLVRAGQGSPLRDKNPNGTETNIGELLRLMVSESDGTASDVLLKLVGGAKIVTEYLREINVNDVMVVNTEKEIGQDWQTQYRNWATPEGAIVLLRALHEGRGLSEQSRALLLKLMTEATTGARRLKGLLPAGTIVAHKTGTSGIANGITAAMNDIGIITLPDERHIALAVFVSDSKTDEATREAVIAKAAQAAWNYWSK